MYVSKFFPDFFWWLSARMIVILWTSAFYHIESSICRWYPGWEIFYSSGNRGPVPRTILPGAIQKTWMPIVGFPEFTGKLIGYCSNYCLCINEAILIVTAEGSRIHWEDNVAQRLIKEHFLFTFSDGFSWVFSPYHRPLAQGGAGTMYFYL